MKPVLVEFGPLRIFSYGLMLALGFLAALVVARRVARERGMDPDLVYDLVIISAIAGIVGARLSFVAYNWKLYAGDPLSALNISQGGLTIYGGVALALLVDTVWVVRRKLDWYATADVAAVGMPLAIAIGRVGCFLNGCCYGAPTNSVFGVVFPVLGDGLRRHPTQLYELAYSLLIFAALYATRRRFARPGSLFFAFLGAYGFFRFLNEFIRVNPPLAFGLSGSQYVSLLGVAAAAAFFASARGGQASPAGKKPRATRAKRVR